MIRWAFIIVVTVAVLFVASENRHDLVMLQLLFGFRTPPLSLAVVVLVSFGAGAAAVALWVVPAWIRASIRARRQRREIELLEGHVATGSASSTQGPGPHDLA